VKASVIVVSHHGSDHLEPSLASLEPYGQDSDVEVILVDNGSTDRLGEQAARRRPWLKVVRVEGNRGFAGGVHVGAEAASGEVLLLLNDDAAAAPGWLEMHLETLARHPEAAASAGRLTSWDERRHDFVRGAVTFDAHAFQPGFGFPVDEVEPPADGEPLPFACGGNMAVRRADWDRVGGLDPELFAYYEDVELGWRLWALGREVVAAPDAWARHRGSATSAALGNFNRGVLFERNALRVFFACADEEHRGALGPAVLLTFLHRLNAYLRDDPTLAPLVADPFGPSPPPASRGERWRRRLTERGLLGTLRHLVARAVIGRRAGYPVLENGHVLMQLRTLQGFWAGFDHTSERARILKTERVLPDREILRRFPRLLVPTYPGDEGLFACDGFRALLPDDWPLEEHRLEEVMHPSFLK